MKVYSLEEVMQAAGSILSGIAVKWNSEIIQNRKGEWQDFDQWTYKNGYSDVVLTLGKGQTVPKDGDDVFLRCRKVITLDGTFTNYEIMNQIPDNANELSLEDFCKGNTPDVWDKTKGEKSDDDNED
jgi:hypothetical protein